MHGKTTLKKVALWQAITAILGILLIISIFTKGFIGCPTGTAVAVPEENKQPEEKQESTLDIDSLAQCLTEKGDAMYGTEWCPHCQNQKKAFGSSFQYINYFDCEKQRNECSAAGITGYPTWIINGEKYPGEMPLEMLASLSGCQF